MNIHVLGTLAGLFLAVPACSAQIPGTWSSEPSDLPVMRLIFEPGGRLLFQVGFEFWNPARWQYDSAAKELRVTIPRLTQQDAAALAEDVRHGFIKRLDLKSKTVVYHYTDSTYVLTLAGVIYNRPQATPP